VSKTQRKTAIVDPAPIESEPRPARRKRRSPEEIMDRLMAAARTSFEAHGYAGATTAAIAALADITEAQLFRYFPSKADLFREAVFEPLNQHFDAFNARHLTSFDDPEIDRDQARLYIAELQQFLTQHSKMLMSLFVAQTYRPDSTEGVAGIDSLRAYFERGAATMRRRTAGNDAKVDPRLMVRVSFAAVMASVLFRDWIFPPGLASAAEIDDAISDFVIDGIGSNVWPHDN
jgi:AcrR family transcriptional regulator